MVNRLMNLVKTVVVKRTYLFGLIGVVFAAWSLQNPQEFIDLWMSKDQQGQYYFEKQDYKKAAELYQNSEWKARSLYLAGSFNSASQLYKKLLEESDRPDIQFSLANAYAYTGLYEQAIKEYEALLDIPEFATQAQENLKVVRLAYEEQKNAPPTESKINVVDTNSNKDVSVEEERKQQMPSSDKLWLGQVRQDPSKFLRQKFQQEYADEQQ